MFLVITNITRKIIIISKQNGTIVCGPVSDVTQSNTFTELQHATHQNIKSPVVVIYQKVYTATEYNLALVSIVG